MIVWLSLAALVLAFLYLINQQRENEESRRRRQMRRMKRKRRPVIDEPINPDFQFDVPKPKGEANRII